MNIDLTPLLVAIVAGLAAAIPATVAAYLAYLKSKETGHAVDGKMAEMLTVVRQGAADRATLVEKASQEGTEVSATLPETDAAAQVVAVKAADAAKKKK